MPADPRECPAPAGRPEPTLPAGIGEPAGTGEPARQPGPAGPAVQADRFRLAFRQVPAAVAVLLAAGPDGTVRGLTCTSASSLSADPPMLVVCLDDRTGMTAVVRSSGGFSVNYLAGDREPLARAFAAADQALDGLAPVVVAGRTGVPVLATGTTAVFECVPHALHPGGDHQVLHGLVRHARFQADAEPLLYGRGRYGRFG